MYPVCGRGTRNIIRVLPVHTAILHSDSVTHARCSLSVMDVHPVSEPVGEEQSQAECEALRKNFCQLVDVVSQGKIPSALYENGIIDDDLILQGHLTSSEYGKKLMQQVLRSVKRNPKKYFEAFCRALDIEMAGKEVLTNLRSK